MPKNCTSNHLERHICSKMPEDVAQVYFIEKCHEYPFSGSKSDICWRIYYAYYDPDFGDLMETPRIRIDYCPFCGGKMT